MEKKKLIMPTIFIVGLIAGISATLYITTKFMKPQVNNSTSATSESTEGKLNVTLGSGEGSAGDKITIPVKFDKIPAKGVDACDFKIKYDSSALEVSEVKVGDIVVGGNQSFSSETDSSNGIVSFLYMDNTSGKSAILKTGTFANISFKVKKEAAKGSTAVSLKSIGAFIDETLTEYTATFKDGNITIK